MRVAVVAPFPADWNRPHGGVEAVCVNLVRSLATYDDLDVHVVTVDRQVKDIRRVATDGVPVHRLPWAGGSTLRNAVGPGRRQMRRYLEELKPDVVHAHDTYGLMVKSMDVPRVFTVHGFIHGDTLVSGTRLAWLRSRIWRQVELAGWADQPHIISISPYVRERVSPVARGRIHDIDNPIAESFFHIPRRERPGVIFSAALICPRKNTLALVEAFARLAKDNPQAELRLAGAVSNDSYGEQMKRRIFELGLSERIKLLGALPRERIQEELAAAGVFALVSLEENAPVSIEEAMAVGVPVVASNRCGMPFMVREGVSGYLVDPTSIAAIADHLAQLLADTELQSRMGAAGRQIAAERFHPHLVARKTREVYLQAIGAG